MKYDRNLVAALVDGGIAQKDAEHMVSCVEIALVNCMGASKPVALNGIGQLRVATTRAKIHAPGPDRGKMRDHRKVTLRYPAVLSIGEPY